MTHPVFNSTFILQFVFHMICLIYRSLTLSLQLVPLHCISLVVKKKNFDLLIDAILILFFFFSWPPLSLSSIHLYALPQLPSSWHPINSSHPSRESPPIIPEVNPPFFFYRNALLISNFISLTYFQHFSVSLRFKCLYSSPSCF